MRCRIVVFVVLMLGVFISINGENKSLRASQKLSISEGLTHNGVTSILEDSHGFFWIGTYDGLNRYDGYRFKSYKNINESEILVSNRVRSLFEDKNGNIWIGTDEGISIYYYAEQTFKKLYTNKENSRGENGPIILKIIESKEKNHVICATQNEGLLFFNLDGSLSSQHKPSSQLTGSNDNSLLIFDIVGIDASNYLLTTSVGLISYNYVTNEFTTVLERKLKLYPNSLAKHTDNSILAVLDSSIVLLNYKREASSYKFDLKKIKFDKVRMFGLNIDVNKNLWIGADKLGVVKITDIDAFISGDHFNQVNFQPPNVRLRISSFYSSDRTGCWVGTFNKGVFRFENKNMPFNSYFEEFQTGNRLLSEVNINSISPYDKDRVLIFDQRGGTALLNTQTEKFETLPFNLPLKYRGKVMSVFVDADQNVWMQLRGLGIYMVKKGHRNLKKVELVSGDLFKEEIIRSYSEDKRGNIWIALNSGVYIIKSSKKGEVLRVEDLGAHSFFTSKKLSLVRSAYSDPVYDYIWIATDRDGLFRVDIKNKTSVLDAQIEQYVNDKNDKTSISSDFVTSIVRLPNNEMWIGTERGGICKVINSDSRPEFISFSEKHGLSNHVVKSVLYDKNYNLWISTNNGINKFNTRTKRFKIFNKEDGLPFQDYKYISNRLDNGFLIFSGDDGFCYFNPAEIQENEITPSLEVDEFRILNKVIFPGDTIGGRVLFDRRLSDQSEIELKHKENTFSIEVKSLHYSNPENHHLKYKLEPINEEWVEVVSNIGHIQYNGLRPGKYVFHVMASTSTDNWSESKVLYINISPPFWKTPLAYFIYVIALAICMYVIVFFRIKMHSLKHNLEIEHLEVENVKKVNAAKLRFFSNISHEIKTPLTLISGPIDNLTDRFKNNSEINEKLQIVQRQSKNITRLIDQVHDFQRSDANELKVEYSNFNFNSFVNDLCKDFEYMALVSKKKFLVEGGSSKVFVSADKDKLEKVFNNLLNNAFKYTKPNDSIVFKYRCEENNLVVSVSDTGRGIDEEDLPHIFERFYQSRKKYSEYTGGSGIGLAFTKRLVEMHYGYIEAESELNIGSELKVYLPIVEDQQEYDQQEIEADLLLKEKKNNLNNHINERVPTEELNISEEVENSSVFLVEDNLDMNRFVHDILSGFFKVRSFANGQECLDAMVEEWPDIIVSDVLMPEVNGFELCKCIKSDIKTCHIPIVLLTACTSLDDKINGLKQGADAYIKKPFDIQHLITELEALLLNRRQLRERFQINYPLVLENDNSNVKDNVFIEKLYQIMSDNLDNQELDMDRLAKEMYLNRTHFYQKIKAITNKTPFELLKAYRMSKAAEFLIHKNVSVNEVVAMTGFKSRTHFSKLFKDTYKVSPSKYLDDSKSKLSK